MERLEHTQETTLSDSGLYEVIEAEPTEVLDDEIRRLKEELANEREQSLRMLAEFDNYRRRTRQGPGPDRGRGGRVGGAGARSPGSGRSADRAEPAVR